MLCLKHRLEYPVLQGIFLHFEGNRGILKKICPSASLRSAVHNAHGMSIRNPPVFGASHAGKPARIRTPTGSADLFRLSPCIGTD